MSFDSIKYNLISGSFCALGEMLTKVAFSFGADGPISSHAVPFLASAVFKLVAATPANQRNVVSFLKLLVHGLVMVATLLNSGLMYTYYIKSMKVNGAAKATVYNFAINYVGSIILGGLFFNELITPKLLMGVCMILTGVFLISMCEEVPATKVEPIEGKKDK